MLLPDMPDSENSDDDYEDNDIVMNELNDSDDEG